MTVAVALVNEKMLTRGPPPRSGVMMISARLSPSKSAAETNPPPTKFSLPANGGVGGIKTVLLSLPLMTAKRIGVPGPVTRIESGVPSPSTSPIAVRTLAGTCPKGAKERAAENGPPEADSNCTPDPLSEPPTKSRGRSPGGLVEGAVTVNVTS